MSTGNAGIGSGLVLEMLSLDDFGFTLGGLGDMKIDDQPRPGYQNRESRLTMLFMPNMLPIFS